MAQKQNMDQSMSDLTKYKIVFLGNQSVGKSSIILRYVTDSFNPNTDATIGVDFMVKSILHANKVYRLHFWDTAGQERFKSLIPSYVKDCQIAILVYDVNDRKSFEDLNKWFSLIQNERGDDIILGIIGNKTDLEARVVTTQEGLKKAEIMSALFMECSAKTGQNLQVFFKTILETLIKGISTEGYQDVPQGQTLDTMQPSHREQNASTGGLCCK